MNTLPRPAKTRTYRDFVMESSRWDGFEFRADDILICTPAKYGTTWTQMICAQLILRTPQLDRPLTSYSPWLDALFAPKEKIHAQLAPQVTDDVWRDPGQFFHKGESGQWRELLTEDDLARYRRVMDERLEPELTHWLEHGRLG